MATQVLTTQPNWASPVLERLEWRTDVLKVRNGNEQRIQLREHPRHLIEYDFLVVRDEYRALQVQLLRWQSERWVIPLWMHSQPTTTHTVLHSTRIYVNSTSTYEYQVGSFIYLSASYLQYEYLPVVFVGPNYITVSEPTQHVWPVGTTITPARYGRLASSVKLSGITSDVVKGSFQLQVENTQKFPYNVDEFIDGLLFFGTEPNRAVPLDMDWSRNLGILDYGTGPILSYDLHGYTEIIRSYEYLSLHRSGQDNVRSLLNHCKGMRSSFLLPTFQADVDIFKGYGGIGADPIYLITGQSFVIHSVNYTEDMFYRVSHPYLRIELTTGAVLIRRVQHSLTLMGAAELITFTTAFGHAFKASMVKRISYVNMSRLDSDAVEFTWITPMVVSMAITTRGIPE